MASTFPCSIVTPSEKVFDGEVEYASIPAYDGQQGIMTGQSPLLARLGFGTLRLDLPGGGHERYLIEEGFAQVSGGSLVLLTERATPAAELDLEEAQAELAEAAARVASAGEHRLQVERDQARALAKKALARSTTERR